MTIKSVNNAQKQFGPIALAVLSLLIVSLLTGCTTPLDFSYRSNVRKVQSALDEIKPPLSTWQLYREGTGQDGMCYGWGGCPTASRSWLVQPPVTRATVEALFETTGWTVLTVEEYRNATDCVPLPGSTGNVSGDVCRFEFIRDDLHASIVVGESSPQKVSVHVSLVCAYSNATCT